VAATVDLMKKGVADDEIKSQIIAAGIYKQHDTRLQALIDEARKQCGITDMAASIIAEPYIWRAADKIPPRDWLYGNRLLRKFPTATVGAGGTMKSTIEIGEALAMVSGRALYGVEVKTPLRVWYYNLEDPLIDTERHIQATCLNFNLQRTDIKDSLFI